MAIHPDTFVEHYPLRVRLITAGVVLFIAFILYFFPRFFHEEQIVSRSYDVTIEAVDIPATRQFRIPPPPRPSIPIVLEDEDIAEDITIEETELESFYWQVHPPDPEISPNIPVVLFDEPAEPIGGYRAIGRNARYPEVARVMGTEGSVVVQALIETDGRVAETVILADIPNSGFGEAALDAIQRTRFKPAKKRGNSVAVWITIPVHFQLKY